MGVTRPLRDASPACTVRRMMTVLDRKIELMRRGLTVAILATRAGCSRQLVRAVLTEKETSRRVRVVIARALRRPVAEVFGNGKPASVGREAPRRVN